MIAALGLAALAETRSQGLKALIRQSGMKPPFTASDIGFRIGPRINAAGRLHDPERALELLLSRDAARSAELALELDGWNRERQAAEARVVEEATRGFTERAAGGGLPPILVAWSEGWHKGVVGVAAGRVAKDFHRPVVLLGVEGETATGSGQAACRGLELHGFLNGWKARMVKFGGHAQAIGLSVATAALWRAARGVGGGGERVARGAARPPGRIRAAPAAARGDLRPAGAARGARALRAGEPAAAAAHRRAAHRGGAAELRQRPSPRRGRGGTTARGSSW